MTDFAKMDVFFYVTTIAVILLTVVLAIAIMYGIKILRDIKYIAGKARAEADALVEDIGELRDNVKNQGAKLSYFVKFFNNLYKRSKK